MYNFKLKMNKISLTINRITGTDFYYNNNVFKVDEFYYYLPKHRKFMKNKIPSSSTKEDQESLMKFFDDAHRYSMQT